MWKTISGCHAWNIVSSISVNLAEWRATEQNKEGEIVENIRKVFFSSSWFSTSSSETFVHQPLGIYHLCLRRTGKKIDGIVDMKLIYMQLAIWTLSSIHNTSASSWYIFISQWKRQILCHRIMLIQFRLEVKHWRECVQFISTLLLGGALVAYKTSFQRYNFPHNSHISSNIV